MWKMLVGTIKGDRGPLRNRTCPKKKRRARGAPNLYDAVMDHMLPNL